MWRCRRVGLIELDHFLPVLGSADCVLLYVEPIRQAANHQLAGLIQNLHLKIVRASPYFLKLEARAAHVLRTAVEVSSKPVSVL